MMSDDVAPDFPYSMIIITLKSHYDSPDLYHKYHRIIKWQNFRFCRIIKSAQTCRLRRFYYIYLDF